MPLTRHCLDTWTNLSLMLIDSTLKCILEFTCWARIKLNVKVILSDGFWFCVHPPQSKRFIYEYSLANENFSNSKFTRIFNWFGWLSDSIALHTFNCKWVCFWIVNIQGFKFDFILKAINYTASINFSLIYEFSTLKSSKQRFMRHKIRREEKHDEVKTRVAVQNENHLLEFKWNALNYRMPILKHHKFIIII